MRQFKRETDNGIQPMSLKDKTLSSKEFLDTLEELSEEEVQLVQDDVAGFASDLQEMIFSLTSQIRTKEGSESLVAALNELLSARSENG